MVDGNGRISRFLINDVLRRDGAVPTPYIIPVSTSLQRADLRPLNYDGALEKTIEREMHAEALYLQQHGRALHA